MESGDLTHFSGAEPSEAAEATQAPVRRDPHELRKEWRAAQVAARRGSDASGAAAPRTSSPRSMTVPGAVVAAVLLVALGLVIYGTARSHPWLKSGVGVPLAIGVYAALGGAVFAASYGYRNGDKRAALKLTAMIMTVATLVVGAVVAVFLLLDSDSGKSQKESRHDRDRTPPDRPSSHSTASFVDDTFDEAVGANYLLGGGHGPAAGSWAAGWYADPWHTARLRYWDGTEWTGRTG